MNQKYFQYYKKRVPFIDFLFKIPSNMVGLTFPQIKDLLILVLWIDSNKRIFLFSFFSFSSSLMRDIAWLHRKH